MEAHGFYKRAVILSESKKKTVNKKYVHLLLQQCIAFRKKTNSGQL